MWWVHGSKKEINFWICTEKHSGSFLKISPAILNMTVTPWLMSSSQKLLFSQSISSNCNKWDLLAPKTPAKKIYVAIVDRLYSIFNSSDIVSLFLGEGNSRFAGGTLSCQEFSLRFAHQKEPVSIVLVSACMCCCTVCIEIFLIIRFLSQHRCQRR